MRDFYYEYFELKKIHSFLFTFSSNDKINTNMIACVKGTNKALNLTMTLISEMDALKRDVPRGREIAKQLKDECDEYKKAENDSQKRIIIYNILQIQDVMNNNPNLIWDLSFHPKAFKKIDGEIQTKRKMDENASYAPPVSTNSICWLLFNTNSVMGNIIDVSMKNASKTNEDAKKEETPTKENSTIEEKIKNLTTENSDFTKRGINYLALIVNQQKRIDNVLRSFTADNNAKESGNAKNQQNDQLPNITFFNSETIQTLTNQLKETRADLTAANQILRDVTSEIPGFLHETQCRSVNELHNRLTILLEQPSNQSEESAVATV